MIKNSNAVYNVFTPVARTYRVVNRILTCGLDGYWRRQAARHAVSTNPAAALDLCTGTGEMALCLHRLTHGRCSVTGVDFNAAMLGEAEHFNDTDSVAFQRADAAALQFSDNSFDVVTISFALRNLNISAERFSACLGECLRVLRPGGRLITIETTQPRNRLVRQGMRLYVGTVVPRLGARISGSAAAYAYLAKTIPQFYGALELAAILRDIGFGPVYHTYLTFGVVAIHEAVKPAEGKTATDCFVYDPGQSHQHQAVQSEPKLNIQDSR